jgi:hypothetical protein
VTQVHCGAGTVAVAVAGRGRRQDPRRFNRTVGIQDKYEYEAIVTSGGALFWLSQLPMQTEPLPSYGCPSPATT